MFDWTKHEIDNEFTRLNRLIFSSTLKSPIFLIQRSIKGFLGEFETPNIIRIKRRFNCRKNAIAVLAHELVHYQNWISFQNIAHGPKFFAYSEVLKKHDIIIGRKQKE